MKKWIAALLLAVPLVWPNQTMAMRGRHVINIGKGFPGGGMPMPGGAPGAGGQFGGYSPAQMWAANAQARANAAARQREKAIKDQAVRDQAAREEAAKQQVLAEAKKKEDKKNAEINQLEKEDKELREANRQARMKAQDVFKQFSLDIQQEIKEQSDLIYAKARSIEKTLWYTKTKTTLNHYGRDYITRGVHRLESYARIAQLEMGVKENLPLSRWVVGYVKTNLEAISSFVEGLEQGVYNGFYDSSQVAIAIAQNPELVTYVSTTIMNAATDPGAFYQRTKAAWLRYYAQLENGSWYTRGAETGHLVGELLSASILPKGITSVPLKVMTNEIKGVISSLATRELVGKEIIHQLEVPLKSDLDVVRQIVKEERAVLTKDFLRKKKITGWRSAEAQNAFLEKHFGGDPPYMAGSQVIEFITHSPDNYTHFVRVHGADNQPGGWMMEAKAIKGLNAHQIQLKYSLPKLPVYISDVYVPEGTEMVCGRVNYLPFEKTNFMPILDEKMQQELSGSLQYYAKDWKASWFRDQRKIGD